VGDTLEGLLSLRRHVRILAFAVKVRWDSGEKWWHYRPTKPWSVVDQSCQFILSALQTSTCLHTLHLQCINVHPPHQPLILSIPTLKTLVLEDSLFVPAAFEVPLSSVTSLSLLGPSSMTRRAPVEHTLRLLRDSLETLEADTIDQIFAILDTVQVPRLTTIKQWRGYVWGLRFATPYVSSRITKLCITAESHPQPLDLPDTLFPQLRELFAPWWLGVQIIPRRPVQVFHDIQPSPLYWTSLQTDLTLLSQSTRGIEELQLYTSLSIPPFLQLLATHVPRLQRLYLCTNAESLMMASLELLRQIVTPNEANLNALTEIHIRFGENQYNIRRPICHILSAMCSWICPALEVAEISIRDQVAGPRSLEDVTVQESFRLRRTPTGEWEEQA
jgi:hypothetical protein